MIKEVSDWESNVGQLIEVVNDGKAPNFICDEWKQIFTQHQFAPQHCLPQGQHKKNKQQQQVVQWRKKKPTKGDKEGKQEHENFQAQTLSRQQRTERQSRQ